MAFNLLSLKIFKNITPYLSLMRLDRPIGLLLLLWPTYWALWLAAEGMPPLKLLIVFSIGIVVMRAAGCVINDIFDRHFDGHVHRTERRPLVTGAVSLKMALMTFFALCLVAFSLLFWLNPLAHELSVIGIALAVIYPLLKRYTHWPQLGLGFAFSWGIPLAFAAVMNHVPPVAWLLCLINCLWAIVYDSEYAMVDREDDLKIGIKSTAILFAKYDRLIIGVFQAVILILLLVMGFYLQFMVWFYLAWTVGLLLFLYQQYLINQRKTDAYFKAFVHNHWFGMAIFIGIALSLC